MLTLSVLEYFYSVAVTVTQAEKVSADYTEGDPEFESWSGTCTIMVLINWAAAMSSDGEYFEMASQ
jgi:hypothetical protein